jgi:hypothetical protein
MIYKLSYNKNNQSKSVYMVASNLIELFNKIDKFKSSSMLYQDNIKDLYLVSDNELKKTFNQKNY